MQPGIAMPMRHLHVVAAFLALVAIVALAAPPAVAASLDQYRAQGVIAERYDGLVEVRTSDAPAEARRLVEQVNQKRRQIYQSRASEQGVSAEQVGRVYATQIMEKAPAGTYFKQPNGSYVRK